MSDRKMNPRIGANRDPVSKELCRLGPFFPGAGK